MTDCIFVVVGAIRLVEVPVLLALTWVSLWLKEKLDWSPRTVTRQTPEKAV